MEKFNNCFKVVHNEVRVRTVVLSSLAWPDISRTLWLRTITTCPPSHCLMRDLRAQKASGQYFGWVAVTSRLEQADLRCRRMFHSLALEAGSWKRPFILITAVWIPSDTVVGFPQGEPSARDSPEGIWGN